MLWKMEIVADSHRATFARILQLYSEAVIGDVRQSEDFVVYCLSIVRYSQIFEGYVSLGNEQKQESLGVDECQDSVRFLVLFLNGEFYVLIFESDHSL